MKTTNLYFPVLLASLIFLSSCKDDKYIAPDKGNATFSLSLKTRNNGRVTETATPAFVLLSIKDSHDNVQENIKLPLFAFGEGYLSESLELLTGNYQLTQFVVLDATNKIVYATPLEGSDLAQFVSDPLPIEFTVTNEGTQVTPQVLAVQPEDNPALFGYASFGFEIVEVNFNFNTNVTIADNASHDVIDYTLEVIAKDAALGAVKWSKQFNMSGAGVIQVPARYAHYTFKATKPGYLSHVRHFLAVELSDSDAISFEFLPEALTDFIVEDYWGDGAVKIYLPNDQNRCKLYARMDIAEGYRLEYVEVDTDAVTASDRPLQVPIQTYYECSLGVPASPCGKNVNLFDNTPFATSVDICSYVDFTESTQAHSIDDVDIFFLLDAYIVKPGGTFQESIFTIHLWKGANN